MMEAMFEITSTGESEVHVTLEYAKKMLERSNFENMMDA